MPFGYDAARTLIWSDFGFLDTSVLTKKAKFYAVDSSVQQSRAPALPNA